MTLRQFFDWIQSQPSVLIYFYLTLFAITILAGIFAKDQGNLAPWNWLYSIIIYLVCIPGIFAITLTIYFFLFERRSILDIELLLQVLPVLMMIVILYLIHTKVELRYIPGFEKLSSLMIIIGIVMTFMWIVDRTRLFAITFIPVIYLLMFLLAGIFMLRIAFRKLIN